MANIKVLFWLHKSKINDKGLAPLKLRLTHLKQRKEVSTGFFLNPLMWDSKKSSVKSKNDESKKINEYIAHTKARVIAIYNDLLNEGEVYLDNVFSILFAEDKQPYTLLNAIIDHNDNFKARIDIDFAHSTWEKYNITYKKVAEFIKHKFHKADIRVKDIPPNFMQDFDYYLKTADKNEHNTSTKYCKNLKRIMTYAVSAGKIDTNPFNSYSATYKDTEGVYLTKSELNLLERRTLTSKRLEVVKDAFLLQCYTGIAYTDLKDLKRSDISVGIDGNKWIIKRRNKTEIRYSVPLLPKALSIIKKYSNKEDQKIMPLYAIQKYNKYLQELADLYGIHKKISSHAGRRTFGNLALSEGVSLNAIAKMLGHSNTLVTQRIYAVTNDLVVSKEVGKLQNI